MNTPQQVLEQMASFKGFDNFMNYFDSLKFNFRERVIIEAMLLYFAESDFQEGFEIVSVEKELPPNGWNGITIHTDGKPKPNAYYGDNESGYNWHWERVTHWLRKRKMFLFEAGCSSSPVESHNIKR